MARTIKKRMRGRFATKWLEGERVRVAHDWHSPNIIELTTDKGSWLITTTELKSMIEFLMDRFPDGLPSIEGPEGPEYEDLDERPPGVLS